MTTGSGTHPHGSATDTPARSGPRILTHLEDAFRRACEGGDPSDAWLRLADRVVRLRFAGPAMAREILPALAHLALDSPPAEDPDLEVRIWDDASTGAATPVPDLPRAAASGASGEPGGVGENGRAGGVFVYRFDDGRAAYEPTGEVLSALDAEGRTGYLRAASAERLSVRDRASPGRTLFAWWARRHGLQMVHASAGGTPAGGVLVVGRAGSGKSTTALACLGSRLGYTADDCCLVTTAEPLRVHGLYATAKVARSRAAWFPSLAAEIRSAPTVYDDEVLLHLAPRHPGALQPAFPLRAVVVPEIGADETRLEPCSAAHALGALAPSTIFQFPGADSGTLGRLADLVRRVPSYRLRLGPDPSRVPGVLRAFLEADP